MCSSCAKNLAEPDCKEGATTHVLIGSAYNRQRLRRISSTKTMTALECVFRTVFSHQSSVVCGSGSDKESAEASFKRIARL